jgi:hypothetical protein
MLCIQPGRLEQQLMSCVSFVLAILVGLSVKPALLIVRPTFALVRAL